MEAATALANTKQEELKVIEEKVAVLVGQVEELEAELSEAVEKKEQVEAQARACTDKLNRAEKLVSGLANENVRWGKNVV